MPSLKKRLKSVTSQKEISISKNFPTEYDNLKTDENENENNHFIQYIDGPNNKRNHRILSTQTNKSHTRTIELKNNSNLT